MKVVGDNEAISLRTGERYQRVVGNGDSVLVKSRGPIDDARLGPQTGVVVEPDSTIDEIVNHANQILKGHAMHYRNGREAKNGDKVMQLSTDGGRVTGIGVLFDAVPGNDYCNGMIAPVHTVLGACMCDCLHLDDVTEMLKEKGLDKRPARK